MSYYKGIGLAVLLAGVVLQPIGWMYTHWITPVSFIALAIGVFILMRGENTDGGLGSGGGTGSRMPGDVHDYSGQMSGGRSTSWRSEHSAKSDGFDNGSSAGDGGD